MPAQRRGCTLGVAKCKVLSLVAGGQYLCLIMAISSRSVTSVGLEFMLLALRRAQAYFTAMVGHNPARTYKAVAIELQSMRAAGSDHVLMEWFNDAVPKETEVRAWDSLVGLAELCRSLRHVFGERNKTLLKNFHRWSDEELARRQRPGLSFFDAYIGAADGDLKQ